MAIYIPYGGFGLMPNTILSYPGKKEEWNVLPEGSPNTLFATHYVNAYTDHDLGDGYYRAAEILLGPYFFKVLKVRVYVYITNKSYPWRLCVENECAVLYPSSLYQGTLTWTFYNVPKWSVLTIDSKKSNNKVGRVLLYTTKALTSSMKVVGSSVSFTEGSTNKGTTNKSLNAPEPTPIRRITVGGRHHFIL